MNINALDLNLLLVFEALMEERSVTRAAHRVGLSQPAVSNALSRLRAAFGDPLLVRSGRSMTPTSRAEMLIGPVQDALGQLRRALEDRPHFDSSRSEETFRVLGNDYAEHLLLPSLARSLEDAPGLALRFFRQDRLFEAPEPSLLAETYHFAVGFFPDAPALSTSLRSEVLWEERNVCVVSAGNTEVGAELSLEYYVGARHVAVFYKSQGPGLIDSLLAQHGYSRRRVIRLPHFASVLYLVSSTNLIATLPERLARLYSEFLPIRILELPFGFPAFRFTLLWHERRQNNPGDEWLRARIREVV